MQPISMQPRRKDRINNNNDDGGRNLATIHIPPPSSLVKLIAQQASKEQSSNRRNQHQQMNNTFINNNAESTPTVMHLKTVNLELSPVTSVKIVSSKLAEQQKTPEPQAPEPPPPPQAIAKNETVMPFYKVSKHFEQGSNRRSNPPPYISSVTPKMQPIVWGSGGFPARLKPVRVKRADGSSPQEKFSPSPADRLRPLEPKLFDFSLNNGHESLSDSNEDFDETIGSLQVDDVEADGATMVATSETKQHSQLDLLDLNAQSNSQTSSKRTSPATETLKPVTMLIKSSSNDRVPQYITNGNNRPKAFPPVGAMPVVPPLGHTLLNNTINVTPLGEPSLQGLPRLPPLKQHGTLGKGEKRHGKQNVANGKPMPTFSMSLVGSKAVPSPVGSSTDSGSTYNDGEKDTMLSRSNGHGEIGSAFRKELRIREKKSAISP